MLGLMFFGWLSFKGLGVGQMPDVDFPVLNVTLTWEGAAPEVMETDVVDAIEDAVMGIEGLKEVSSKTRQGTASVTLEFELGRDIDAALQEVQSKISSAQQRLPRDMDPPVIIKTNPEDQPIMWISIQTDRPVRELMEYVDLQLKDKFKTVPGVGEVFLGGYVDRNLRVWVDADKLAAFQLTVDDVVKAIQREHVEKPAGRLETADKEANVRAMGEARNVKEFGDIMIDRRGSQPIYKPIQLKEVARIEDGLADMRRISRVLGEPAVGLGVRKQRGMNSVQVARNVKALIKKIEPTIPAGYKIGINFDSTRFIEDSVHELVFTLILSALLTAVVCWIFLGSWSSTMNILLAIPTSILGSFIVIKFMGFTLNTFTLLGLSLAIGIVVDDAIMVLENIVRHREKGEEKVEAALKGSEQISFAALAATLAIGAIFLPVIYMKGIIGKFFFQFGITITAAVFLSLLEALTLAPMRCAEFLEMGERKSMIGKFYENSMKAMERGYAKGVTWSIHHRALVLIGATLFFVASLFLAPHIRKELMPAQDQSMFLVRIQTPIGSSIEYTSERFKEAEALLMKHGELNRYYSAVGGFEGGEVNSGNIFVNMKQPKQRPHNKEKGRKLTQEDFMDVVRKEFSKIPGVSRVMIQDLSMRGFAAKRGFPIEYTIRGPLWEKLGESALLIQAEMKKSPFFTDVDVDYDVDMPEIRVYPDRQKAFDRGVSVETVANTINAAVGGQPIAKYTQGSRRYDVRVKLEAKQRMKASDIEKLMVWNNRGEQVLIKDVVRMENKPSLLSISRSNRERAIGVFANVGAGKSQADAINQAREISKKILPEGYHAVFSGTSETFKESFTSLFVALALGILVSYMILASQFNHIIHPVTVLLALPFSISGALMGLFVANQSLNMFSFIGILLLMGIVKKNSILLVDFTNQMREQGMKTVDALQTACPMRLRPILMTSIATIAAAVPPALALGPGAETRIPMAVAVIGGVIVSTILTLFVVPAAYRAFDPIEEWMNKIRKR